MDTKGVFFSNFGQIEEALLIDRTIANPDLEQAETGLSLRERMDRWWENFPRLRQTVLPELRRHKVWMMRRNGNQGMVNIKKPVFKHKVRIMLQIAELNPHLYTDSYECFNHAHELGEDLFIFAHLYNNMGLDTREGADLVNPLQSDTEKIFKDFYEFIKVNEDAVAFHDYVEKSHQVATVMSQYGDPSAISKGLDQCVRMATALAERAPHLRVTVNEFINKFYGKEELLKHKARVRQKKHRGLAVEATPEENEELLAVLRNGSDDEPV